MSRAKPDLGLLDKKIQVIERHVTINTLSLNSKTGSKIKKFDRTQLKFYGIY